jgi:hypothetical protein
MESLIGHVLDAPVANLCLLAGLLFLAIAVVGNVSGKIQPGNNGRIAAGVLGVLLLVYGITTHSTAGAVGASPAGAKGADRQVTAETASRSFTPVQGDTDLYGGDYKGFDGSTAGVCEAECKRDAKCRAWTFVNAGVQGPQSRCYLKDVIPAASSNTCCASGHEM